MNPLVELNLALILFLPWFAILGALYWLYPRQPRDRARRLFDIVALLSSTFVFMLSVHWSHAVADRGYGHMWPQVLATSLGYGAFLATLIAAFFVRRRWLGRRAPRRSPE